MAASVTASSLLSASPVIKLTFTILPGSTLTLLLRHIIGSRTIPTVLVRGWVSPAGFATSLPRPMKFPLIVSYCKLPAVSPSTVMVCTIHRGLFPVSLGRREAMMLSYCDTSSVLTNRLLKAGWATSADCGASTGSK